VGLYYAGEGKNHEYRSSDRSTRTSRATRVAGALEKKKEAPRTKSAVAGASGLGPIRKVKYDTISRAGGAAKMRGAASKGKPGQGGINRMLTLAGRPTYCITMRNGAKGAGIPISEGVILK